MRKQPTNHTSLWIAVCLAVLTLAVYWQATGFEFTNFDDDRYVTNNTHVTRGITVDGVIWAFTTRHAANWHPLTWISHMLDSSTGDLDPGRHHLTSVLLHVANVILLFLALVSMTSPSAPPGKGGRRGLWRSAFVAGLFAVHPLHVESVAWIAERKDVLSAFFWVLTMLAYAGYAKRPSRGRYLAVVVFYALGLLSKPMLVSLPLVLLMLDYWPLGRFRTHHENAKAGRSAKGSRGSNSVSRFLPFRALVIEKMPLFALALASCVVTFVVQRSSGAVLATEVYPVGVRLANAVVAYVAYLVKTVWPVGLACFYPHPGTSLPVWQTVGSGAALGAIMAIAVMLARRKPYVLVGWLWYVVTLIPVIGLVQVGRQAMADRYTYVPLIGIFIIVAWAVGDLAAGSRRRLAAAAIVGCAVLAALSVASFVQVGYWKDSVTLFGRAVRVTRDNGLANYNLGCALKAAGDDEAARRYVRKALRLLPDDPIHSNSNGCDLLQQGMVAEAIGCFQRAIEGDPQFEEAYCNLGIAYAQAGETAEAMRALRKALQLDPRDEIARRNLRILEERARGE